MKQLTLKQIPGQFCICRLPKDHEIPKWVLKSPFFSVSRTHEELSIVIGEDEVQMLPEMKQESGWTCLKVEGVLDFSLTGILASIATPLAENKISLFAISTFDTDYILVKSDKLSSAIEVLRLNQMNVLL